MDGHCKIMWAIKTAVMGASCDFRKKKGKKASTIGASSSLDKQKKASVCRTRQMVRIGRKNGAKFKDLAPH